jgi:enoyl-CoA hydratase
MPETAIGLFPDVGIGHLFARMPWSVGLYLGLTGRAISRDDAYWLGLVTHCIASSHFEPILAALADVEPVDPLLDGLHEEQGRGHLQAEMAMIRDYFSDDSLVAIVARLTKASGASKHWAEATLLQLRKRSPLSLAITDRQIRACRTLDLRETLVQDYRLAWRCLEAPDFAEGVRAALVDKDNAPKWNPETIEQVTQAGVDAYFAPLGEGELKLLTREEMQAARV